MPKPKEETPETEDAIIERMNRALKHALTTPHETNKEMVERRRQAPSLAKQREADIERRKRMVPAEQKAKPRKR